jgi:hypothetical protein
MMLDIVLSVAMQFENSGKWYLNLKVLIKLHTLTLVLDDSN